MASNEVPRRRVRLEPDKGGRPVGSMNRLAMAAREAAQATGVLPHELLLQWGRGEPMSRKVPPRNVEDRNDLTKWTLEYLPVDEDCMRDAAKSAAPYYAPKISTVEVISGVSDAALDDIIRRAAAEAGLSIGPGGESEEDKGTAGDPE